MSRIYSVPFSAVADSAAVDVFEITPPTTRRAIALREIVIGQSSDYGDAAAEGLSLLFKRGHGHTAGSSGSAVTPVPHASNDRAAVFTATTNNTTQASAGGGSLTTIRAETFNVQSGYQYLPLAQDRIIISPGDALVVSITAPADALTVSGTAVIEELD